MKVVILNPDKVLYEGEVRSVFLPGDRGEFEVLDFHKPIISLLRKGRIVVDWKDSIPIRRGIVKMFGNELIALVE